MLRVLHEIPAGLLTAQADELQNLLGGPTLIHLTGRRDDTLFVSTLLHGNEDTGWLALQALLQKQAAHGLPRNLSLFIGNVASAQQHLRRLEHQPDYNRVWPGAADDGTPEHALMREVMAQMTGRKLFASVDIHNNTGLNPHYACINRLEQPFFHLATLFSRTVVYFVRPLGVQSSAFAPLCPAVTLECGKSGSADSVEHALGFLDACLHLAHFPEHAVAPHDMDLFHTVATVKIADSTQFGFGPGPGALRLDAALDHMNFRELSPGTRFGQLAMDSLACLDVRDETGRDVAERYFSAHRGELVTRLPIMPAMLTRDELVIRQDCLCYLMERLAY